METQLLTQILKGYNRHARPAPDPKEAVTVDVSLYLLKIKNIVQFSFQNVKDEISIFVFFRMKVKEMLMLLYGLEW